MKKDQKIDEADEFNIIIPSSHEHSIKSKGIRDDQNSLYQKMNELVLELNQITQNNFQKQRQNRHSYSNVVSRTINSNIIRQSQQQNQYNKNYMKSNFTDSLVSNASQILLSKVRRMVYQLRDAYQRVQQQISKEDYKNRLMLSVMGQELSIFLENWKQKNIKNQQKDIVFFVGDSFVEKAESKKERMIELQWTDKQLQDLKKINKILTLQVEGTQKRLKEMSQQVQKYKKIIGQKNQIVERISKDNQYLNQKLFDLEQKIVQIDLQIERRVNILSKGGDNGKSSVYLKTIQQLTEKVQTLTNKNHNSALDLNYRQIEFKTKMKQIKFREKDVEEREAEVFKKWQQIQNEKDKLMRRQSAVSKLQNQIQTRLGDIVLRENELQILKGQMHENYKSFNQRQNILDNPHQYYQQKQYLQKKQYVNNNQYQPQKFNNQYYQNSQTNIKGSNSNLKKFTFSQVDNDNDFKSKYQHGQLQNKFSHMKQTSKFGLIEQKPQYNSVQTNVKLYSSGTKPISNAIQTNHKKYQVSSVSSASNNRSDIESKLEKLRSEIKRQIDSIN